MGIITGLKNLNKVAARLKKRKFKRVREIVRDYGVRELMRRVRQKMGSGDVPGNRIYVITNESYYKDISNPRGYYPEQTVEFVIRPGSVNIGKLEILTINKSQQAAMQLQIYDMQDNLLTSAHAEDVAHYGYTAFEFLPVPMPQTEYGSDFVPQKLRLVLSTDDPDCGILVNHSKRRHGFDVIGGGSVICRIYTRLDTMYLHWMKNNTPTPEELDVQRAHVFEHTPKFSIVVPLYNTPERLLREMIDSATAQTYANWELCLADGSTGDMDLLPIIEAYGEKRIQYKKLEQNEGISGNTNKAIEMATGDYICFLDHDDILAPQALYRNAQLINKNPAHDFIYSDEDKITDNASHRFDPFFKPDFSPDMLNAFNYITHFTTIKKSLLDEVGLLDSQYNGAQDYDLYLRATEAAQCVGHIHDILYHWRIVQTSTAYSSDSKSYTIEAGKAALEASVKRRGVSARVEMGVLPNYYNVAYAIPAPQPKISIIIPNHNEKKTLKTCVDSILKKSTYQNFELVILENNSTDTALFRYYKTLEQDPHIKIATWNHPFNFAALNNYGATQATGDLLLFINNDMSIITPDWLEQMAMHAQRPEIGAVGAKLLYPDNTVQHGGIVLRIGGIAGHSHKYLDADDVGAFARMAIVHDVSAVTGACVMLRKEVFAEISGFDEQFVLAYNDVDFCLKIRKLGYYIVWTPYAQLYHYESKTRGYEDTPEKQARQQREGELWLKKWEDDYPYDPFYNKNLSLTFQDYSIRPDKVEIDT